MIAMIRVSRLVRPRQFACHAIIQPPYPRLTLRLQGFRFVYPCGAIAGTGQENASGPAQIPLSDVTARGNFIRGIPMKKPFVFAAAALLLSATAAFAQADNASGNTMMKGKAPAGDAAKMPAPADSAADADAGAAKPKAHHRMAKNEAAMNASEAETTKQLNEQQAQMAKSATQ
jgi:hypothetical protein